MQPSEPRSAARSLQFQNLRRCEKATPSDLRLCADFVVEHDDTATAANWLRTAADEIERLLDRAVCSGCGSDVGESGVCPDKDCDDGEMIPASDLPWALRQMRDQREMWRREAMSL